MTTMSDLIGSIPELDDSEADDHLLPWDDPAQVYRAFHTRPGRTIEICFIPNTGTHDRNRPLADKRNQDTAKDGTEIILDFSDMTVVITGRNLRRGAQAIADGRCFAVEAFDGTRRAKPDDPKAPFIDSIRFFGPRPPPAKAGKASRPRVPAATKPVTT
jgi:hypothetical protein